MAWRSSPQRPHRGAMLSYPEELVLGELFPELCVFTQARPWMFSTKYHDSGSRLALGRPQGQGQARRLSTAIVNYMGSSIWSPCFPVTTRVPTPHGTAGSLACSGFPSTRLAGKSEELSDVSILGSGFQQRVLEIDRGSVLLVTGQRAPPAACPEYAHLPLCVLEPPYASGWMQRVEFQESLSYGGSTEDP